MTYEVDGSELRPVPGPVRSVETLYEAPDADALAAAVLSDPGIPFAVLGRRTTWRPRDERRWRS